MAVTKPTGGIWRTIHGAKVFLKPGQTPAQAFAESGRGSTASEGRTPASAPAAGPGMAGGGVARYDGKINFRGGQYAEVAIRDYCERHKAELEDVIPAAVADSKMFPDVDVRLGPEGLNVSSANDRTGAGVERVINLADMTIHNEWFGMGKEAGKGTGTEVFARQVENASNAGFKEMHTLAARSRSMNGYYTWPRLGYDGNIPLDKMSNSNAPGGAKKVSDLMKTPEGRAWWKENGISADLVFDLRPGSQSRRILDAYRAEKQKRV